jgi:Flp pilus assembly protein TadD
VPSPGTAAGQAGAAASLRLVDALLAERRADEAEQVLLRLVARPARDAETLAALAALQAAQGRPEEAARHAEEALRLAPLPPGS